MRVSVKSRPFDHSLDVLVDGAVQLACRLSREAKKLMTAAGGVNGLLFGGSVQDGTEFVSDDDAMFDR